MSTALQKQHQKIIRSLMQQPAYKKCADCGEQCAVNVDITHSIFVCTSCSGIHREFGHRIKSVSMATFTQDEIAALQKTNNDEFNRVWMANWRPDSTPLPLGASDEKRRLFLTQKYVEKKWYSDSGARPQEQSNPYPQQQSNPYPQQPAAPAQPQNFSQQNLSQQRSGPTVAQGAWSPFDSKPSQPAQPASNQNTFNPFPGASAPPAQQPNQLDSLFGNDPLIDFGPPKKTEKEVEISAARRDLRDLLSLVPGGSGPQAPGPGSMYSGTPAQNLRTQMGTTNPGYGPAAPNVGYGAPPNQGFQQNQARPAGFGNPQPGMVNPQPGFGSPQQGFGGASPGFGSPQQGFGGASPGFGNPSTPQYGGQSPGFGNPSPQYGGQNPGFGNQFATQQPQSGFASSSSFNSPPASSSSFGASGSASKSASSFDAFNLF